MKRFGYSLRVCVVLFNWLIHSIALLRLTVRNVKSIQELRQACFHHSEATVKRWWEQRSIALQHYWILLKSVTSLAGSDAHRYKKYLDALREHVQSISNGSTRGNSCFLKHNVSRMIQADYIHKVFKQEFSINLDSKESNTLGYYAFCTDAVLDFLVFCRQTRHFSSKEDLVYALPYFTRAVQPYVLQKSRIAIGDLARSSSINSAKAESDIAWLKPSLTLTRTYWKTFSPFDAVALRAVPSWFTEMLTEQTTLYVAKAPRTVRAMLVIEMHLHSSLCLANCISVFSLRSLNRAYPENDSEECAIGTKNDKAHESSETSEQIADLVSAVRTTLSEMGASLLEAAR